jgi:three-Cys-motif partner protein
LSTPRTTVWRIEEHTRGKHAVLREYLAAWFPILGSFARRLVFIDGFAGPGEYEGGEQGSPIIALETYRKYGETFTGEVIFLFVENDADRMERLGDVVSKLPKLPGNVKLWADPKGFEPAITKLLDGLRRGAELAPAFVMVDPFGVKDYPMSLLARLLKSGRVELYISFMYEFIDRFKSTPEFEQHLTSSSELVMTVHRLDPNPMADNDSAKESAPRAPRGERECPRKPWRAAGRDLRRGRVAPGRDACRAGTQRRRRGGART